VALTAATVLEFSGHLVHCAVLCAM